MGVVGRWQVGAGGGGGWHVAKRSGLIAGAGGDGVAVGSKWSCGVADGKGAEVGCGVWQVGLVGVLVWAVWSSVVRLSGYGVGLLLVGQGCGVGLLLVGLGYGVVSAVPSAVVASVVAGAVVCCWWSELWLVGLGWGGCGVGLLCVVGGVWYRGDAGVSLV